MIRIKLVVMPVMHVSIPSLSLTQLQAVTRAAHGERVDIEVLYLNHAFAVWMRDTVVEGTSENLYDICVSYEMGQCP